MIVYVTVKYIVIISYSIYKDGLLMKILRGVNTAFCRYLCAKNPARLCLAGFFAYIGRCYKCVLIRPNDERKNFLPFTEVSFMERIASIM